MGGDRGGGGGGERSPQLRGCCRGLHRGYLRVCPRLGSPPPPLQDLEADDGDVEQQQEDDGGPEAEHHLRRRVRGRPGLLLPGAGLGAGVRGVEVAAVEAAGAEAARLLVTHVQGRGAVAQGGHGSGHCSTLLLSPGADTHCSRARASVGGCEKCPPRWVTTNSTRTLPSPDTETPLPDGS